MTTQRIRIGVIGMGFGACFAEIYQAHPDVEYVGICDTKKERLATFSNYSQKHEDPREIIESDAYDAVHILTPVTTHVAPTLAALRQGKHVACAVPMATALDDLRAIIAAQRESGRHYMMMETDVYTHTYFCAQELYRDNILGRIQFMRGCHSQDLEQINPLWRGLPPMWYMTHAVAPLLDILNTQAERVHCYGSGVMQEEFHRQYGNPYPIETAIFKLRNSPVRAEITRTLFETAPYGGEAFDLYGDRGTFVTIGQQPLLVEIAQLTRTGEYRSTTSRQLDIAFRPDLLPEALRSYASGGHGGSHAHLAHEFIRSIVEHRQPRIDAITAANWCAAGICAHESAMRDGAGVDIPLFV